MIIEYKGRGEPADGWLSPFAKIIIILFMSSAYYIVFQSYEWVETDSFIFSTRHFKRLTGVTPKTLLKG
jgi:hypothetical protein